MGEWAIDILEHWEKIAALLSSILLFIKRFRCWIKNKYDDLLNKFRPALIILPENTQFPQAVTYWNMGKHGNKNGMQVMGYFIATNRSTNKNLFLTGAELKKSKAWGQVCVQEIGSNMSGTNYAIPPGFTTHISVNFWIPIPVRKQGEDLIDDVIVIDQFGKKYRISNVKFTCV